MTKTGQVTSVEILGDGEVLQISIIIKLDGSPYQRVINLMPYSPENLKEFLALMKESGTTSASELIGKLVEAEIGFNNKVERIYFKI